MQTCIVKMIPKAVCQINGSIQLCESAEPWPPEKNQANETLHRTHCRFFCPYDRTCSCEAMVEQAFQNWTYNKNNAPET